MIINKVFLIVNLYKNQYEYVNSTSMKFIVKSVLYCVKYSQHCDGFSLYPHQKKKKKKKKNRKKEEEV